MADISPFSCIRPLFSVPLELSKHVLFIFLFLSLVYDEFAHTNKAANKFVIGVIVLEYFVDILCIKQFIYIYIIVYM